MSSSRPERALRTAHRAHITNAGAAMNITEAVQDASRQIELTRANPYRRAEPKDDGPRLVTLPNVNATVETTISNYGEPIVPSSARIPYCGRRPTTYGVRVDGVRRGRARWTRTERHPGAMSDDAPAPERRCAGRTPQPPQQAATTQIVSSGSPRWVSRLDGVRNDPSGNREPARESIPLITGELRFPSIQNAHANPLSLAR
jgi:hypothetical protein